MPDTPTLFAYIAACIAIILAPGPAQALVLSRTLSDGRKSGVMTAIGLNVGTVFHALAAALGLSVILATSALAFSIVKYIGAAYLVYLGIQALRTKTSDTHITRSESSSPMQAFSRAVMVGILNPKVALFFLAFLPQFVDPARGSVFAQFLLLGSLLALLDIFYETVLVFIFNAMSGWLTHNPRFTIWRQRVTGTVLIGLGVRLAFAQRE
jgi:RhtB (resistance to homoserine/threonine) family protein